MSPAPTRADIVWRGQPVQLEYQWVGSSQPGVPLVVFLHEGLGSVAMWRDFPTTVCAASGSRGLVYSRPGYGHSTPRAPDEHWGPDFLQRQALEVLPALLLALGLDTLTTPPWLFGHSDGGSIALLHAAAFPERVAGTIVLAPHIFVEALSIRSIAQAREAYLHADLRPRLARYHADPDSAFWGWNDIWLDPAFRHWRIDTELSAIRCPLLAVQGLDDEYGTLAQIEGIAAAVPGTELLTLADCGHSPQRDQPQALISAAAMFIARQPSGRQLAHKT